MDEYEKELLNLACAITRGSEPSPAIAANYPHYSAAVALDVYRHNYRGNLHDALAGAYPVVLKLVGADFFRFLAREFIETNPPQSANLHRYGAQMAFFLTGFAPATELVYLPDVAALEWACNVAYFAADADPFDFGQLAQVAPERYADLIMKIHPACQVVRSAYPLTAIWHAHQDGAGDDFHIDLGSGASIALVSRKDNVVEVSELSVGDAKWLQFLQAGKSLGEATAAVLARHPDFDLQASLLTMVAKNVLIGFEE